MRTALPHAVLFTPTLLVRTARLRSELAETVERSRDLVWLGGRRRSTGSVDIWPLRGGSDDAGLIVALISGVSLCLGCIAKRSGVPVPRVEATLTTVAGTISLRAETRSCDACLETRRTYRLDAAAAPTPGAVRPRGTQGIILDFLRQRSGEAFCAECIARWLFDGKNIDVAMRHLEGNGVHRRHAHCAACGKQRLVATLPSPSFDAAN